MPETPAPATTGTTNTARTDTARTDTARTDTASADTESAGTPGEENPTGGSADGVDADTVTLAKAGAAGEAGGDEADAQRPTGKARPVARVSTLKPKPEPAPQSGRTPLSKLPQSTHRSVLIGTRTIVTLLVIAALLGIFALIAAFHPGAGLNGNRAFVDKAATSELVAQAQTKICKANAATFENFDGWANEVRASMTGTALDQFNTNAGAFKDQFAQTRAKNDCRMDAIGVRDLTGEGNDQKASVVVSMIVSGTANGVPTQSVTPRYQVSMVKRDDQWLIENLEAL